MRGEYTFGFEAIEFAEELPPRARRILWTVLRRQLCKGTTSACAENTRRLRALRGRLGNYLRVRGEYAFAFGLDPEIAELPPRARRIPPPDPRDGAPRGTTSAFAENTVSDSPWKMNNRNYLRVRGEYRISPRGSLILLELPPRARRIPGRTTSWRPPSGTTSACAENTPSKPPSEPQRRNYLRVRGEYPK